MCVAQAPCLPMSYEEHERTERNLFSTVFLANHDEYRAVYVKLVNTPCFMRWQAADNVVKMLQTNDVNVARLAAGEEAEAYRECIVAVSRYIDAMLRERVS